MWLPVELFVFVGLLLSSRFLLRWWKDQEKERRRYPPSLPSLPLVGSLPFLRGFNNIAVFFFGKTNELGPIFTFRAGKTLVLVLNSREVIGDALVNHSTAFSGRSLFYTEEIINPNNRGLTLMRTTQEWKKYHQLSLSILKQFGFGVKSMMEARISAEIEFFTAFAIKQNAHSFNPKELILLCVTNIIMNIIFGRRHDYNLGMTELGREIIRYGESSSLAFDVAPMVRFLPYFRNLLRQLIENQKMIHKILTKEIEKSLEVGAEDCFVRRFVENAGPDYDTEQLRFTARDLIAAGTDTTANTLLWTLIALANNPDVQERLKAEIDSVVPRDMLPSLNDQPKLPFVDATILEIQRWKTLIPLGVPRLTLSDTKVGDYFVPAETLVLINLYAAHMNPKVWQDPEIFRPERFLNKAGQVIGRESIIPFSLGRRSCLGEVLARAELFLILTGLVQRFIIRPPEGQKNVNAKPTEPVAIVLTPAEFSIRLIARD